MWGARARQQARVAAVAVTGVGAARSAFQVADILVEIHRESLTALDRVLDAQRVTSRRVLDTVKLKQRVPGAALPDRHVQLRILSAACVPEQSSLCCESDKACNSVLAPSAAAVCLHMTYLEHVLEDPAA